MKYISILASIILFSLLPSFASSQVNNIERTFAERVAVLALDNRCNLFDPDQRRAVNAFMMQSRGQLLTNGTTTSRVNLLFNQARNGVKDYHCTNPKVTSEAQRIKQAHIAWRAQLMINHKGANRIWVSSRAGVDNWRTWQDLNNNAKAGFILVEKGLAFGIEIPDTDMVSAHIFLRNAAKIGLPVSNTNLKPAPRIGTDIYTATRLNPASTKKKVIGKPNIGSQALFSNEATRKLLLLDPRDCFEIEVLRRSGKTEIYIVEVGDLLPAFAHGAEL